MFKKLGIVNILEIIGIIGALIFSYLAYTQSTEAIQISTKQTQLMQSEINPIIKVKMNYFYEENTTKELFSTMNIFNNGEKIRNYDVDSYNFIHVNSCIDKKGCTQFYIPINKLTMSFFSENTTEGNLGRVYYSPHDYVKYKFWRRNIFMKDNTKQDDGYTNISVSLIVLIDFSYNNLHNEKKHDYLLVNFDMGNTRNIDKQEFKELSNLWENTMDLKEFNTLNYEDLKNKGIKVLSQNSEN